MHHFDDVAQDLARIVLDPTRSRKYLLVFFLAQRDDPALHVEHEAPRRGRSLINGGDVLTAHCSRVHADVHAALERLMFLCIAL